jgi:cadmium resistance protein CadD (predicted permease)
LAADGLGADLAVAAAAFVGTNLDNCLVTTAMVAGAPVERAHRIAAGQVAGFALIVAAAAAAAVLLFEFSSAVVGLLGLVPLAIGLRGLWALRGGGDPGGEPDTASAGELKGETGRAIRRRAGRGRAVDRAVGRSFTAAALVTIAAGGDNLAVYIPLFRVGGLTNVAAIAAVFVAGEAGLTAVILWGGRHPRARTVMGRVGHIAVPVLLCVIGVVVMVQAGTFGLL